MFLDKRLGGVIQMHSCDSFRWPGVAVERNAGRVSEPGEARSTYEQRTVARESQARDLEGESAHILVGAGRDVKRKNVQMS